MKPKKNLNNVKKHLEFYEYFKNLKMSQKEAEERMRFLREINKKEPKIQELETKRYFTKKKENGLC